MNHFHFIKNFKRNREMARWVEDHKKKCKGRIVSTKDNNDLWSHNSDID
jgi:hypothetical protein